jgi:tetratricopeptide (TPR) repeat protein
MRSAHLPYPGFDRRPVGKVSSPITGYVNRQMGNYEQSKISYEQALAADLNHVRTWSYYGMWQMEQGNRLKAEDFLTKVKLICGTPACEEYRQLKAVIDGSASYKAIILPIENASSPGSAPQVGFTRLAAAQLLESVKVPR